MDFFKKIRIKYIISAMTVIIILVALIIVVIGTRSGGELKKKTEVASNIEKIIPEENIIIDGGISYNHLKANILNSSTEEYMNFEEQLKNIKSKNSLVDFQVIDISVFDDNDNLVQPSGNVSIRLPISEDLLTSGNYKYDSKNDIYKMYKIQNDGSIMEIESNSNNVKNIISFTTNEFGTYAIAKYNLGKCSLKTDNIDDYVIGLDLTMYAKDNITIYDGPNETWNSIGTYVKDQKVHIIGEYQENGWYEVQTDNITGFIDPLELYEK